ncbi:neutral zinc metallopeptidase [Kribbella sp. NPDC026611]|uniref:neutral zinc metallopeptidase n=1 Tax=Kribbella sp. NPDC026611 TaxID=3154911 RepID=UPI003408A8F0
MSNQGPYGPPPQGPQYPPPPQYGPPPQQYGPPSPQWGPPPAQQQQFGWGAPPGGPRPPKSGKGPLIALAVILGVVLLGAVGLAVVSNILKHNGSDDPYYSSPTNSTSEYTPPAETPSAYPTDAPSTTAATSAPRTTAAPRTTRTQPARPTPTRTTPPPPSDLDLVARNRIYKSGVQASVGCREPAARPSTAGGAQRYYQGILACLNRAWPRQIVKSGGQVQAPRLVVFTGGQASSPCSGNFPGAFYCGSNDTIYMDAGDDVTFWRQYGNVGYQQHYGRMRMADTVAHEYGHHVQEMVGIMEAQNRMRYEAGSEAAALQISRRTELQASCFGNVFLGSNRNSLGIKGDLKFQLDWLHAHQGDEYGAQPDHGSREVLKVWTARAYASRNPASCNTFTASPQMVR